MINFFKYHKLPEKHLDGRWNRAYRVADLSGRYIGTVYHDRLSPTKSRPWGITTRLPINPHYATRVDAAEALARQSDGLLP